MNLTTFNIIFLACSLVMIVVRVIYARGLDSEKRVRERQSVLDGLFLVLTVFSLAIPFAHILLNYPAAFNYNIPVSISWAGVPFFIAAIWLMWRSHADLGRNWTSVAAIKEGHTLITFGVYSKIRHPMYAAHFLWAIAQLFLIANLVAGPALLIFFTLFYLVRIPAEEKLLMEHFGDEYREYMKHTSKIVPKWPFSRK